MLSRNVELESKTILVTGAAGFIGSNLVKRIFTDVKDVTVIGIDSMNGKKVGLYRRQYRR